VVPVDGQQWSSDPFVLTRRGERLHGRGTADMKGYIAACLVSMRHWRTLPLARPIHLALSFDEEVGCLGVPLLIDDVAAHVGAPAFVWVGEPTGMRLATAHKGFCLFRTTFRGTEAHSSLAHRGVSAIAAAVRFAQHLLDTGALLAYRESRVIQQLPRHTTFNLGLIDGGSAINIIARHCALTWDVPARYRTTMRRRSGPRSTASSTTGWRASSACAAGPASTTSCCSRCRRCTPIRTVSRCASSRGCSAMPNRPRCHSAPRRFFAQAGWPAVVCGPGDIEQAISPTSSSSSPSSNAAWCCWRGSVRMPARATPNRRGPRRRR
jgi:acetylornithine deacetylase